MPEAFRYPIGSRIIDIPVEWQMPFTTPATNLAEAHRVGIRPVTFDDIERFCKNNNLPLENAVLTDESDAFPILPNNWRITRLDQRSLELQLTKIGTAPGLIDVKMFPRVEVSSYETLFTGVIITEYLRKDTSQSISLQKYHDWNLVYSPLPQPEVFLAASKRYLADKNGKLHQ